AIEAFRVRALDYLVKPFTDARFAEALERACDAVRAAGERELGRRVLDLVGGSPRLAVRVGARVVSIDPADVDWIEADSYYAKLHVGRAEHLLRESLTSLEARLDPARFVLVHRSAIVNVERVRAVDRDEALLAGGARVPVARDRCRALLAHLERRRR